MAQRVLNVVLLEILGEGIGENFEEAQRKAKEMKAIFEKVFPDAKLKILYDDELAGNGRSVGFIVANEIMKK